MINHKVDFILTLEVENANPNGDPLTGNMPRINGRGFGEISDVCLKRKLRNRFQDMGHEIFVKSAERSDDGFTSLQKRFEAVFNKKQSDSDVEKEATARWLDIRSFGQVFTYQDRSLGIRGPVSISIGRSIEPINITTMQITKSVNGMDSKKAGKKSSDTMGTKHFVDYAIYIVNGSVNCYLAEKTGFSENDLVILKESLRTLFVNDVSSARPDGSMQVKDIYWINHTSKVGDISSGKLKDLLIYDAVEPTAMKVKYDDYHIRLDKETLKKYEAQGISVEYLSGL